MEPLFATAQEPLLARPAAAASHRLKTWRKTLAYTPLVFPATQATGSRPSAERSRWWRKLKPLFAWTYGWLKMVRWSPRPRPGGGSCHAQTRRGGCSLLMEPSPARLCPISFPVIRSPCACAWTVVVSCYCFDLLCLLCEPNLFPNEWQCQFHELECAWIEWPWQTNYSSWDLSETKLENVNQYTTYYLGILMLWHDDAVQVCDIIASEFYLSATILIRRT
jgi:hypothetical protein